MKATPEKIKEIATPEVKSYVAAYLLARTFAEVTRERVDAVHLGLLTECPIYADVEGLREERAGKPILKSGDLYLSSDDAACQEFYAAANHELRKRGIKPDAMSDDHCPALVAEHALTCVERMLIDASGRPLGVTADGLLGSGHGLENWRKWIDLVVSLIVSLPDFKNPLTGKAA